MDCLTISKTATTSGRALALSMSVAVLLLASGCTSLINPINAIPAERVPPEFLAKPRANKIRVDPARLRRPPNEEYLLDAGDVLGIFIEGELGGTDEQPPVRLPEVDSNLPPAIGYPVPIREDGTISLPTFSSLELKGQTIREAEETIRDEYSRRDILKEGARVIVTLMKERTYRIVVIRQDGASLGQTRNTSTLVPIRNDQSSGGYILNLPAYQNDVMNALAQTGGLPGVNAKNEVKILRSKRADDQPDAYLQEAYLMDQYFEQCNACNIGCQPLPAPPETGNFIRIPLRYGPGETPTFTPRDVILEEGDILYVEARETEVFYTGGNLGGGEFQLPRDYDLDVLGAMSIVGQGVGSAQRTGGLAGIASVATIPPGELIVLRKLPGNRQLPISVNISEAVNNPQSRLLVQAGDTLILRYRPREEILNFATGAFFTYGIRELLRQ